MSDDRGKPPRRDPRADRDARRGGTAPTDEAPRPAAMPSAGPPAARVIDNPDCLILAVPDFAGGRLSEHDREVIGAARHLADALSGAVVVLAAGGDDDLGAAGADRVVAPAGPRLSGYGPETLAALTLAAIAALEPRHVLFPESVLGGGDVGRRVAARLGERLAAHVLRISGDRIERLGGGGAIDYTLAPPRLMLMAPGAGEPVHGLRHEARPLDTVSAETRARLVDTGLLPMDASLVPLAEADFVVAAGNGVDDWPAFHRVAQALGATEGASRAVCDSGAVARDRQVGASGSLIEPRCYLAFGISGATQHLQGITRCEHVIAVNTDLHAAMIKRADLAIVADAQQVMPALYRLVEEKRHGS